VPLIKRPVGIPPGQLDWYRQARDEGGYVELRTRNGDTRQCKVLSIHPLFDKDKPSHYAECLIEVDSMADMMIDLGIKRRMT
jgi:hypothetical protein